MDILKLKDAYLNTLFFRSKNDYANGLNEIILCKLLNISVEESQNLRSYLTNKKWLEAPRYDNDENVILTTEGFDLCLENRQNKIFKSIQFTEVQSLPQTGKTTNDFIFYYNVTDENGIVSPPKTIAISISWMLNTMWGFQASDLIKVLVQIAKDKISEKIKEGTLNDFEEVVLLTNNSPNVSPYDPKNLPDVAEAIYEVEIGTKSLSEKVAENKLAAAIIEMRDIINAVFYSKNNQKLLLLNEERNLLDFFKPAITEEDFSHRIASLGQISRNLNVDVLRKLTSETDTSVKSVQLLDKLLITIGQSDKSIIDTLKYLGRIRQGYPIHTDVAGIIEGLAYFKVNYPIEDYENAWKILLKSYLHSLKALYKIFSDEYLKE